MTAAPSLHERRRQETQLSIRRFESLAALVDQRGPRQWLIRGVWPAGDYGVHGGEPKAQKTWNVDDLAVSVASGTPWLGAIPIDTTGPVIQFRGEGGDGNGVRRTRSIASSRGLDANDPPIWVCIRAPHLTDEKHLAEFRKALEMVQPKLVILDPLYLAAAGANGANLYAMGRVLERPQHLCQEAEAALSVVTHYNRARDLKGPARFTGAGPAEWGRVLIGAEVHRRYTDPATLATTVLTELTITGGEIPDQTIWIRRTIRALDPDDLDSPLDYRVDTPEPDEPLQATPGSDLAPAAVKLRGALEAHDTPVTSKQLVDWIADRYGHGLKRETASRELNRLRERGLADYIDQGNRREKLWLTPGPTLPIGHTPMTRDQTRDITRDRAVITGGCDRVTVPIYGHTPRSRLHGHRSHANASPRNAGRAMPPHGDHHLLVRSRVLVSTDGAGSREIVVSRCTDARIRWGVWSSFAAGTSAKAHRRRRSSSSLT